jgi:hypothetical protein
MYLIRYGIMGNVERLRPASECSVPLERGQIVVLQTHRGIELGEVLIPVDQPPAAIRKCQEGPPPGAVADDPGTADRPGVLRLAGPEDLAHSRRVEAMRADRFAFCQRILREAGWPWELIDVEPMLDDRATVLHYLGPHRIDVASLRARFRMTSDFDVVFEPVGADLESEAWDHASPSAGGGCGSCGCSDGGCGTRTGRRPAEREVSAESGADRGAAVPHSGCASCGISRLLAARGARKAGSAS